MYAKPGQQDIRYRAKTQGHKAKSGRENERKEREREIGTKRRKREIGRESVRLGEKRIDRQADKQTDGQTNRQTDGANLIKIARRV